ncbi:WD repeat-containing protein 64 [Tritrichomonas musculus]|uniref:WD repeat-containing protein 64 n=1 Tax=Tritrichomonas musculus TaxID=1915356 RepID=A0ABR2L2F3_9EUKA
MNNDGKNAIPMNEFIGFIRDHKKKQEIWEKERIDLENEVSVLTAKKAAWDLCRNDLIEQINLLHVELGIKTEQIDEPPPDSEQKKNSTHKSEFIYSYKSNIPVHLDCVRAVAFYPSPDSKNLFSTCSDDGTIKIIDIEHHEDTSINTRVKKVVKKRGARRASVKLSAPMPTCICSLRGHSAPVISLASLCYLEYNRDNIDTIDNSDSSQANNNSNNNNNNNNFDNNELEYNQILISGATDGSIAVWQLPKPDVKITTVYGEVSHNRLKYYTDIHSDAIWSIEPIPNSPSYMVDQPELTYISHTASRVLSTSADGTLKVWDVFANKQPIEIPTNEKPLICKVISPISFMVACQKCFLQYYECFHFKQQTSLTDDSKKEGEITSMAISKSDQYAIVGFSSGTIKIVHYPDLSVVKELKITPFEISSITLTPCKDFFIVCCSDGKTIALSLDDFSEKDMFEEKEKIMHLKKYGEGATCTASSLPPSSSEDSSYYVTGGADGVIHIFSQTSL